jgi:hypothetical protein
MKPKNVKELIGYVIDKLGEEGFVNVYAVFDGLPNALVIDDADVYKIMLWKDGISLHITLKKDTLEPVAVVLAARATQTPTPAVPDWWRQ